MATILQIENYEATTAIDLTSLSGISVAANNLERALSYTAPDELVTRAYNFRVTGTSKADVRDNVNEFIDLLRQSINWKNDPTDVESMFLREAADGEDATRMLITNYEARAVTRLVGIDPFQTAGDEIFVEVAFTLQNHREEPTTTTLSFPSVGTSEAVGRAVICSGGTNTKPSRVNVILRSDVATSAPLQRLWIGFKSDADLGTEQFEPVWPCDYASALGDDTTETTSSGSYGTNVAKVSFATNSDMAGRVWMNTLSTYGALGMAFDATTRPAKGVWVALVRYKVDSGSAGNIFARIGSAPDTKTLASKVSYNEPQLLDNSGNWRFMVGGIITIPAQGYKRETALIGKIDNSTVSIAAQRLGSGADRTVVFDSITFIPYDHYLSIDDAAMGISRTLRIQTDEDFRLTAYTQADILSGYYQDATVTGNNNFMYPAGVLSGGVYLARMVIAGERDGEQTYNDDMDYDSVKIYNAFEAYNG